MPWILRYGLAPAASLLRPGKKSGPRFFGIFLLHPQEGGDYCHLTKMIRSHGSRGHVVCGAEMEAFDEHG